LEVGGGNPDAVRAALPAWGRLDLDGATWIRLPDGAGTPRALQAGGRPDPAAPAITPDDWRWLEVQSGIVVIEPATVEHFVPQMLNFEHVGGVNFQKGCYPGQEIVARTHYRGILKRRMALAHLAGEARPLPGQSVYSGAFGDQAAGAIVNVAAAPGGGFDLLVVAQIESLDQGDLRWNAPDGPPLEVRERPYAKASGEPVTPA